MAAASDPNTNLVWIDLEMTGLDWEIHRILEVSCIITNKDLEMLAQGPHLIVHQSEEQLAKIDPAIVQTFLDSGLIEESRQSSTSEHEADLAVYEFIREYCHPHRGVICGNGIYLDRAFMFHQMPRTYQYLDHRVVDVSSIKELYKRWRPGALVYKKRSDNHRALGDIQESIAELKFYRDTRFIQP